MEHCSPLANAGAEAVIVGRGNPLGGDDAIGLVVARCLHQSLSERAGVDLLELSVSNLDLVERLAGYRRAVIIDALIDGEAQVGAVQRVEIPQSCGSRALSAHTATLDAALDWARAVGLPVPEITVYGIAIRQPQAFSDRLSERLRARLPDIVSVIAAAETPH